jgi:hypothetical protein
MGGGLVHEDDEPFPIAAQKAIDAAWKAINDADAVMTDYFWDCAREALKRGDYEAHNKYTKLYNKYMVSRVLREFNTMDLKITDAQLKWAKDQQIRILLAGLQVDETLFRAMPASAREDIRAYVEKNWPDTQERAHLLERIDAQVVDEVTAQLFNDDANQEERK